MSRIGAAWATWDGNKELLVRQKNLKPCAMA